MEDWLRQLQQSHPYFRLPDDEEMRKYMFAQQMQSPEMHQQMLESLLGTVGSSSSTYGKASDKLKDLIKGTPQENAIDDLLQKQYMESMSKSELDDWMKTIQSRMKPASMKGYKSSGGAAKAIDNPVGNIYEALIFALGGR
jgi:hypothetical protein